jgi:hypothetical protein
MHYLAEFLLAEKKIVTKFKITNVSFERNSF